MHASLFQFWCLWACRWHAAPCWRPCRSLLQLHSWWLLHDLWMTTTRTAGSMQESKSDAELVDAHAHVVPSCNSTVNGSLTISIKITTTMTISPRRTRELVDGESTVYWHPALPSMASPWPLDYYDNGHQFRKSKSAAKSLSLFQFWCIVCLIRAPKSTLFHGCQT